MTEAIEPEFKKLGFPKIDEQHQRVFELLALLNTQPPVGGNDGVVGGILLELVSYAKEHFTLEEDLMRQHGFPGLAEHEAAHRHFEEEVKLMVSRFLQGEAMTATLHRFVFDWLEDHIPRLDAAYVQYIKAAQGRLR